MIGQCDELEYDFKGNFMYNDQSYLSLATAESVTRKLILNTRRTFCAGGYVWLGTRLVLLAAVCMAGHKTSTTSCCMYGWAQD